MHLLLLLDTIIIIIFIFFPGKTGWLTLYLKVFVNFNLKNEKALHFLINYFSSYPHLEAQFLSEYAIKLMVS